MSDAVCIGVAVHAEPAGLLATVRSVLARTDAGATVVLLPDGPDAETAAALAADPELRVLPQWPAATPRGGAAAFNRLARHSDSDAVVLLESGTVVGPRWWTLLRAALDRPGCGLAGPSTNLASNRQQVLVPGGDDPGSVDRAAAITLQRFGAAARTLGPRHGLGDFCYAVRREVIDAVGEADEAYGLGPYWELDYDDRAARAGFRGVWVGAAYVYRAPPTWRTGVSRVEFEARNRIRFEGRQSQPGTGATRPASHPAGARAAVVPENRRLPHTVAVEETFDGTAESSPGRTPERARSGQRPPLVSAIMPTRGRPDFARQAVAYFLRQDYPNTELVVVDDGDGDLAAVLPDDPRVRVIPGAGSHRSIGALRNVACQEARGEIVIQWDDDDWHGPTRISRQTAAIVAGSADLTALRDAVVFDLPRWRFWRMDDDLHRRMFVRDVHGGTLAFRRSVWERSARYPDRSLAEDAAFLDQAVRRGGRLEVLPADGLFVYVRHGTNSWQIEAGAYSGWKTSTDKCIPLGDRWYYAQRSSEAPMLPTDLDQTLITCIMPTFNRREFVPRAVEYFQRQDHPARELVVLDDGQDPVSDLIPDHPSIVYRRLEKRVVLGTKRNLACELARGEFIAHWDDDDWQAPDRLTNQLSRLQQSDSDVCGSSALSFWEPSTRRGWRYEWPRRARAWAAGPSLFYRRAAWARSPFPDVPTGEDSRFVWSPAVRSVCDVSDLDPVVGIVHSRNTVAKTTDGAHWRRLPAGEVERRLGPDADTYRRLS